MAYISWETRELGGLMENVLRLGMYIIEYFASMFFTFSLFRLLHNAKMKIFFIVLIMSFLAFYLRVVENLDAIAALFLPIYLIVACMVIFAMPIFYSFLIGCIFTASGVIAELLVANLLDLLKITSYHAISSSAMKIIQVQLGASLLLFLASFVLLRRKYGFQFLKKQLAGKKALTPINFIVGTLLVIALGVFEFALLTQAQTETSTMFNTIILLLLIGILLVSLILAYHHNKNLIKSKYSDSTGYDSQVYKEKLFKVKK